MTARFVASDSAKFYYSSLGNQLAGIAYQNPQGYVATSLTSRRNNALLSSSWIGAISFAAAEGTEVFSLDHNLLAEAYTVVETTLEVAGLENDYKYDFFVLNGYSWLDVNPNKTMTINMPPALIMPINNPTVFTTFGERVEIGISVYLDQEGDEMRIDCRNDVKYKLNFYPVLMGNVFATKIFKVRSDVLVEGVNAELGKSTVSVTYVDAATYAEIREEFEVEVISQYDY